MGLASGVNVASWKVLEVNGGWSLGDTYSIAMFGCQGGTEMNIQRWWSGDGPFPNFVSNQSNHWILRMDQNRMHMPTKVCSMSLHFSLQTTKLLVLHPISLRLAQQSFQEWLNLRICICQVTVGPYKLVRVQWWKRENIFLSWGRAGSQGPISSWKMWKGNRIL